MNTLRKLSLAFASGGVGAIVFIIVFIIMGKLLGIPQALDWKAPPPAMPEFLYKQIVWGGIFAFLFVVPIWSSIKLSHWALRGIAVGVIATLVAWFVFLPQTPAGTMGENVGQLFWLVSLILNSIWGLAASWWYGRVAE